MGMSLALTMQLHGQRQGQVYLPVAARLAQAHCQILSTHKSGCSTQTGDALIPALSAPATCTLLGGDAHCAGAAAPVSLRLYPRLRDTLISRETRS